MPWCDTDAMAAHLIEISAAVDPGAHAVLIVDQAGWHFILVVGLIDAFPNHLHGYPESVCLD